jgi:hypothetical protein
MNPQQIAVRFLRAVGAMLFVLGLVHLVATPHIPDLLNGSPVPVYERAVGPMLLNHVLVGILLLPLGYTTWLTAASVAGAERWAVRILIANTIAVFTLPLSIAVFMRRPEYYTSPLFLAGVGLVVLISLLMLAAVVVLTQRLRSTLA